MEQVPVLGTVQEVSSNVLPVARVCQYCKQYWSTSRRRYVIHREQCRRGAKSARRTIHNSEMREIKRRYHEELQALSEEFTAYDRRAKIGLILYAAFVILCILFFIFRKFFS